MYEKAIAILTAQREQTLADETFIRESLKRMEEAASTLRRDLEGRRMKVNHIDSSLRILRAAEPQDTNQAECGQTPNAEPNYGKQRFV